VTVIFLLLATGALVKLSAVTHSETWLSETLGRKCIKAEHK